MRVGTRGSALALAQAGWVAERLGEEAELVTIDATEGDTDKSRWVSALERALLDGFIDVAVHSAKDVPTQLPDGLELVAIPERADPRDAICGAPSLGSLPPGARVGTSSLRRAAQLRAARPDLHVVPVRGNVDTRLRKLADGHYDALVLAAAGLRRLGLRADGILTELVPAAGQGALAIEARVGTQIPSQLRDPEASTCVRAERELVHALGASCESAVGAHARVFASGRLELTAWVGHADGSSWILDSQSGPGEGLGGMEAARLLAAGAAEMLG